MATIRLTVLKSVRDAQGKYPILVCVSQKEGRAYIRTEFLLDDVSEWEKGKVAYRKDAGTMNKRIAFVLAGYEEKFKEIEGTGRMSALQIKRVLTTGGRREPRYVSLVEYWRKRIGDFRKEGRESYAKMNEDTVKVFVRAEKDVPIQAVDHRLVEHFDKWMAAKGHSDGNRGMRLTHLKARLNELIRDNLLKADIHPFAYTKIPSSAARECDLTVEEFGRILAADFAGKEISLARDMFLLSFYLCGINLKDLLSVGFDGSGQLTFERCKVSRSARGAGKVSIPVRPEAQAIIDKYRDGKGGRLKLGYSFTYENLRRFINRGLKKLGEAAGIASPLCFYSARKTFAQFASELGIPDSVIDYCLGHSDKGRGIIRYYTKVKRRQAEIAVNRVIDYVHHPDKYKDYIEMRADIMMMRS